MSKAVFPTGKFIFKENELNNAMYIILKGKVEIFLTVGKSVTRLAIMEEGDFFGEMALFSSRPRSASARCLADTELAIIESKQQLQNFLLKNPKFSAKMVSIMADRLAKTNDLLTETMSGKSAVELEYSAQGSR
ncbi:Crp/Fnr family transcriptional regulator [Leptospira sp. GIMC2001]|uniref:Crp/Fnr family transcriptional regulator n=1 Tax=Leptospira sp. GIMC2001 TaxID=1513297 RepID=UPI00234A8ECA|nr:cyclic nucleotide-binding domain-containing protein [Leptospira sp. GIMC2001]WCL47712.1 cyclic nucleotide-binding domain-containing protein [Leptospira sp. GIMC2001]